MAARGKHSWEQTKWWEQVTTQPTYSGPLTAGGSHPAQLEEAGAPKSAALALLMAWKMLALEKEKHGKKEEIPYTVKPLY